MKYNFLDNIIVKHLAGSHAYGTSTPASDVDYRGIFLAEKEFIITPFFNVKEATDNKEEDTKFQELNRYMELYTLANPNILETLWVEESDISFGTEIYDHLRNYRSDLLSSKIAFTYTGYAYNQCNRMKNHHGWMDKERIAEKRLNEIIEDHPCVETLNWLNDNFPDYLVERLNTSCCLNKKIKNVDYEKFMKDVSLQLVSSQVLKQYHFIKLVHNYMPQQLLDRDFNMLNFMHDYELVPYGENIYAVIHKKGSRTLNNDGSIHVADTANRSVEEMKLKPDFIVKFNKKEYEENSDNRKNYHKWKQNRNKDRSVLESQYGYDTKHAMHVVRLLRTAEEALQTGEILVKRPDAEELLAIRNGEWKYEDIMKYFDSTVDNIRNNLYNKSVLRKTPDIKKAAKILVELREMQWYGKENK